MSAKSTTISVYLGIDEQGNKLDEQSKQGAKERGIKSLSEFIRHCIRFTLQNDKPNKQAG